jgi:hypothetical protein
MLASITPLGERARGQSWSRAAAAYVVASTAGGAAVGGALGAAGALVLGGVGVGWRALLAGVGAVFAVLADRGGRLPSIRRQVDERWLMTYRDWVYGAGFGVQLGIGALTIVTSASIYLTWAIELASASTAAGAIVGATFGVTRALPLLTLARVADPGALRAAHRRWQAALPAVARLTLTVQAASAVALLAVPTGGLLR